MWHRHHNTFLLVMLTIYMMQSAYGASGKLNCPTKCKCNETVIKCIEKQMNKVPDFRTIKMKVITINLQGNDIEEITSTSFFTNRLDLVRYINMNDNSIVSIEENAFSTLSNLQHLDLSNNLLDDIPSSIIANNKKLTELNLSGNFFNGNAPELVSTSLEVLDLSFCKILKLRKKNLNDLPNLQVLYLYANDLKHVDISTFVGVKLTHINLSYNPWKCHCDVIKLFDYLIQKNLTKIDEPIKCMHPNKWHEDIYNSEGPMHHNKLCNKTLKHLHTTKEPVPVYISIDKQNKEVTQVLLDNFESTMLLDVLIITIIIGVAVVIALVSLIVTVRVWKSRRPVYAAVNSSFRGV